MNKFNMFITAVCVLFLIQGTFQKPQKNPYGTLNPKKPYERQNPITIINAH